MPNGLILSDANIESIYKTSPIKRVDISSVHDTPEVQKTDIHIFDADDLPMNSQPIMREYHEQKALKSFSGSGKVAEHKMFVLQPALRGKGIAKKLHDKEMPVYLNNEFVEIHLDAAWDGIFRWEKFGFKYEKPDVYQPIVYSRWRRFFLEQFQQDGLDRAGKYAILLKFGTIKKLPEKYKKGFGTWLLSEGKNFSVPMYKRVV